MKKASIAAAIACAMAAIILIGVLVLVVFSDGLSFFGRWDSYSDSEMSNKYEYSYAADKVSGLDINWVSGKVEIVIIESGSEIKITEHSNKPLDDKERLKLSTSGGTLHVSWHEEVFGINLFNWFDRTRKDLFVEVPKELAGSLEELVCDTVSADITANGFTAENIKFDTTSGRINSKGITAETVEASSVSGEILLEDADCVEISMNSTSGRLAAENIKADEVDVDSTSGVVLIGGMIKNVVKASTISGSIHVESNTAPGEADFNSVSGPIKLLIPENEGFVASYDSVSGSFSSDFPVSGSSGKSGKAQYGNGSNRYEFSTTSGSMQIIKK